MILQSIILAVACTGVVKTGPTNYTLNFDVGRGLCNQVVIKDSPSTPDDVLYYNTYIDFSNVYATFESGTMTGLYCSQLDLVFESYNTQDELKETFNLSFSGVANKNLVYGNGLAISCNVSSGNADYLEYYITINNATADGGYFYVGGGPVSLTDTNTRVTFLEDNFYTYYDYNVGGNSYQSGFDKGYQKGKKEVTEEVYAEGYRDGYREASSIDATVLTAFQGIASIAMLPVDLFLKMLNFTILGINLSDFVTGLLTVGMVLFVVKMFIGSSGGGSKE